MPQLVGGTHHGGDYHSAYQGGKPPGRGERSIEREVVSAFGQRPAQLGDVLRDPLRPDGKRTYYYHSGRDRRPRAKCTQAPGRKKRNRNQDRGVGLEEDGR